MTLPLLVSVPHAGLTIPPEVAAHVIVTPEEIAADGDQGAKAIYAIADHVAGFVTTDVARAFVDMNRAPDDFSTDGVVKSHTCWSVPIYAEPLPDRVKEELVARYWAPYHEKLKHPPDQVVAGLDLHTMAEAGPPVAADAGQERPFVCIGNGQGAFCPKGWGEKLAEAFGGAFPGETITLNAPFSGGYISRSHSQQMPWLQIEFSRTGRYTDEAKRAGLLRALNEWVAAIVR